MHIMLSPAHSGRLTLVRLTALPGLRALRFALGQKLSPALQRATPAGDAFSVGWFVGFKPTARLCACCVHINHAYLYI